MIFNILRFAGVFLATLIGIPLVLFAINRVFGVNLTSAAIAILPFMVAALFEGHKYGHQHSSAPDQSALWVAGFLMAGFGAALALPFGLLPLLFNPQRAEQLAQISPLFLLAAFVFAMIMALVICRVFFGAGIRAGLNKGGTG